MEGQLTGRLERTQCRIHKFDELENEFFTQDVATRDPEIADVIGLETGRQRNQIELIASENIASRAVLEVQGSVLTNKYAEGYPGVAIMAVASMLILPRALRLSASKNFMIAPMPMCSPIPARKPIRLSCKR